MKKIWKLSALLVVVIAIAAPVTIGRLNITEEDGSPSTFPWQVKFTNGSVTDNGDGTTSVSTSGGGSPGGSGSELQFRSGASTFGAVTNSSVSGGLIYLGNDKDADDEGVIDIEHDTDGTDFDFPAGINIDFTATPTASNSQLWHALSSNLYLAGSENFTNEVHSGHFYLSHDGTGTVTDAANLEIESYLTASGGTITTLDGVHILGASVAAGTTIGTNYGVHIGDATGAGTVTTNYGLYIDTIDQGGTDYAIYTNTGTVRLGDSMTIPVDKTITIGTSTIQQKSSDTDVHISDDLLLEDTGSVWLGLRDADANTAVIQNYDTAEGIYTWGFFHYNHDGTGLGSLLNGGRPIIGFDSSYNAYLSGFLEIAEVSAPATPASGFGRLYEKTDGKLYWKNDAGTESDLTAGASGSQNLFETIAVSGQDDVVADSSTDTLTLVAGTGMTITTSAAGDSVTFASSGGSDTNAVKEFIWPAPALLPLQTADSIPPITKTTGTNYDVLTRAFDPDADEGVTTVIKCPVDITSGTVTFYFVWFANTATSGNVIWAVNETDMAEGTTWDSAANTITASADAVQSTVKQITVTTVTETVSNLGWSAGELIELTPFRDADNGSDSMNDDAQLLYFGVGIPRA